MTSSYDIMTEKGRWEKERNGAWSWFSSTIIEIRATKNCVLKKIVNNVTYSSHQKNAWMSVDMQEWKRVHVLTLLCFWSPVKVLFCWLNSFHQFLNSKWPILDERENIRMEKLLHGPTWSVSSGMYAVSKEYPRK